ncbi:transposase [Clostridium sp. JN-9]|uniref:transposase n=1 Tax=Clostridium sp. JN-9 TaxID=2507159 RepID=UPI000FFE180E|nr:transposase [Clostridium sp. JN-9]QAT40335.1 transposase [Clostridium sp. JN-9]QAT41295.1 transposase [Clostridium sp. JN-9]
MLQLSKNDKDKVLEAIKEGRIDAADVSFPNLIDTIVLKMKNIGLIDKLAESFKDKRKQNKHIPFHILIALAITAKMKLKTSLTDVAFAVTDGELLSELGWNMWDTNKNLEEGLFAEGVMRNLIQKYDAEEFIESYNNYVQNVVMPSLNIAPSIHILDCTKIHVNLDNVNYENSETIKDDGKVLRGYKMGTLRGLMDDSGIIEEIVFDSIKPHDLELCRNMILKSKCLKSGDILINDRGFISRDVINILKLEKQVDTYVPAKKNMTIYQEAVKIAISEDKWQKHPNKKRKTQEIHLVKDLGMMWQSNTPDKDVDLCACVVHDKKDNEYYVFLTTDTNKTAKQIINTYELRPEIEEDYRQIKDFWKLEDFKSTKYNFITFHIVMTLIGYMYFQLFKNMEEGNKYSGKSLPVIIKNYKEDKQKSVIIYSGQYFGVFSFIEFIQLYAGCSAEVRKLLDPTLALV